VVVLRGLVGQIFRGLEIVVRLQHVRAVERIAVACHVWRKKSRAVQLAVDAIELRRRGNVALVDREQHGHGVSARQIEAVTRVIVHSARGIDQH
jgi:hypothetical protein